MDARYQIPRRKILHYYLTLILSYDGVLWLCTLECVLNLNVNEDLKKASAVLVGISGLSDEDGSETVENRRNADHRILTFLLDTEGSDE